MNKNDLDAFEKLFSQLAGIYDEISLLSKKKPNDPVNAFKLKFTNNILESCNHFLPERYKPFDDFEIFDVDDLPFNSDVVLILSQYLQSFQRMKSDNSYRDMWKIKLGEGEESDGARVDDDGFMYRRISNPMRI